MSESHKGKVPSEETKQKISESLKGKVPSEETKQKMSAAKRKMAEETKQKISESHKGRPKKRSIWLNDFNQEIKMADCCVAHHHPTWVKVRDL